MNYGAGLSVQTDTHIDQHKVFTVLAAVASDISQLYPDVRLTAYSTGPDELVEEENGDYFDEYTMFKVLKAIMSIGLKEKSAMDVISALQRAGILFREYDRGRDSTLRSLRQPERITLRCPVCDAPVSAPNDSYGEAEAIMSRHLLDVHHVVPGAQEKYSLKCEQCEHRVLTWEFDKATEELRLHIRENHSEKK